ncbi:hypothetical protein H6F45_03325 [Sphaerospermopsis sp. FACHB-1194]|jgi:hypothetical protein|nr:hypothetical protein [Sphaerospermopsis sp. FACHB-1194]
MTGGTDNHNKITLAIANQHFITPCYHIGIIQKLERTMRGLENDYLPKYTEADLIEKWQ